MVVDSILFSISLRDAGRGFLISLRASSRYSSRYLDALEATVALLCDYAEPRGWPQVKTITTGHIESYLAYLQVRPRWFRESSRSLSQSTIETTYRRLLTFFNWLKRRGHVEDNPLYLIPHPHIDEREVLPLSDQEQAALVEVSDPIHYQGAWDHWRAVRNRAALFLFLDTLGRRDEIGNLTIDDIDPITGEIRVMGKGRKERWMPLGDRAQLVLREYLRARALAVDGQHRRLWVKPNGRALQAEWPYLMLKRLANRAGIVGFHTHRTRHNYAVRAIRAKVPIPILERAGGWKRIPATYLKTLGRDDVLRFHRETSPLDNMDSRRPGRRSRL